jgi:hypothetical protein
MEQKKLKKQKLVPRVPQHSTRERDPSSSAKAEHSGKRLPSPSAMVKALGEEIFPTVPSVYAVKCDFSFTCASLPRVLHSGKMAFPECLASPSVFLFLALGKASLLRV